MTRFRLQVATGISVIEAASAFLLAIDHTFKAKTHARFDAQALT